MRSLALALARPLGLLSALALRLAGAGIVVMTAVIAWQVFGRYVLNASPSWSEALSVQLMGWFILLGAAAGIREGTHLGFDVLLYVLPPGAKAVMRSASDLVTAGFGLGMVVWGMMLVTGTWSYTIPTLGLPGGTDFLPLVAGGALAFLFGLERLVRRLGGLETIEPDSAAPQPASPGPGPAAGTTD